MQDLEKLDHDVVAMMGGWWKWSGGWEAEGDKVMKDGNPLDRFRR